MLVRKAYLLVQRLLDQNQNSQKSFGWMKYVHTRVGYQPTYFQQSLFSLQKSFEIIYRNKVQILGHLFAWDTLDSILDAIF